MNGQRRKFGLGVENLESRALLAGDVLASVVWGSLKIQGDADANQIAITDLGGGVIRVEGLDDTTINGKTEAQEFAAVRFGVKAELFEGDDAVSFEGNSAHPLPQVSIETHGGDDTIAVDHVFSGLLKVGSGDGNDVVKVLDVTSGLVFIETGLNDDLVQLGDSSVRSDATIRAALLKIETGAGDDSVEIEDAIVSAWLTKIDTGMGDDRVSVDDLQARAAVEIQTGEGTDAVALRNSAFSWLTVDLGAGDDDQLTIAGSKSRFTRLSGGSGTGDTLSIMESDLGFLRHTGFENVT